MSASRTARYVALYRALETRSPSPLFVDPYAPFFLSRTLRLAARVPRFLRGLLLRYADRRAPGARTSAIGRTRFIDDVVANRVRDGAKQLVLLGAGFDCRAHRLNALSAVRVFEVDRADTQAQKRKGIERAKRLAPRTDVVYVTVDFARDDVADRLRQAGWDAEQTTIFVWEGVTNYLSEPDVAKVFQWIGRAARASTVVFTYIHRGVLDGSAEFEGGAAMVRNVARLGEPWRFGLLPDEVGPFVARFGLVLRDDIGADDYRALFPALKDARGYAFYRLAVAEKK